jgi:hypothetical protein
MLSRRRFLTVGLASVGVAATTAACSSNPKRDAEPEEGTATDETESDEAASDATPNEETEDFAARFAQYDAAREPDGDLSKVIWPAFVTAAGPEVQRLYEFQVTNGEVMRYMPCFCGCGQSAGHRNNRDCYIKRVDADGSVEFDSMAPT